MKKRIFSWVMAVAMVMSLVPGAAFATGDAAADAGITEQTVEAVAQIGETEYATLAEAAAAGGNVTLLKDVQLDAAVVVTKDVTIDLAGFDISMTEQDTVGDGVFHVTGGTLTIDGEGVINGVGNNDYSMAIWADGGNVVINGGTYTNVGAGEDDHYDLIYAKNGGTVTITGGNFECQTPVWTLNLKDNSSSSIVVQGGTFEGFNPADAATEPAPNRPACFVPAGYHVKEIDGSYTVCSNDTIVGKEVTLDGNITVTDGGIVVDEDTTVNLGGYTISAAADTIGDGVFHVTGGTLTINGEGTVDGLGNNDYSMAVWADGGDVVINGGTYTNVGAGSDDHYDLIYAKAGSTVTITGGAFECHTPAWTLNLSDNSGSSIVVEGGSFKGFDPATGTTENPRVNFVAEGFVSVETDGVWTVEDVREAQIGDTKYATLAAAVAEGGDITLLKDVQLDAAIEVSNTVTIDLAGFDIAMTANDTVGDGVFHVVEGGTLTIGGEGTVNGLGNNNYSMAIWADGGDVVINGGTYTNVGAGSDDHYDLIYVKNGSTVTISGGTFVCHTPAWTLNSHDTYKGTFVVKGGAFKGYNPTNGITENPPVNFVAEGYEAVLDGEYYVVDVAVHTVTFMDGETQLDQKGITHGVAITKPADPTKDGYTFAGWYVDADLTTAYDFSTVVTGNITLYAKWTENVDETPSAPETDDDSSAPAAPSNPTVDSDDAVEVKISSQAVAEADKTETPVTLSIDPLSVTGDAEDATTVKIDIPANAKSVTVEIPVENVTPGTVVVLVDKAGNETVVNTTGTTENGVVINIDGDVTVKVVENSKQFQDVSSSDWYDDAVAFASSRELMNGMTEDTFGHNVPTSRAMVAQILHNMEGKADNAYTGSFNDVSEGDWYADAIHWAAENNIISGVGNGNFAPNDCVTREQLAVMIWKYAGAENSSQDIGDFKDCDEISSYAEMAIRWAVENGLMSGKGNGQLDPKGNATRAEVASVLMKFFENVKY